MQQAPAVLAGRYELGPVLGSGGMATVYRARDRQLGRDVAVKVLAEHLRGDGAFVERFRREAQAAARLEHPNLVTVFDTGHDGDVPFIVMELVQGETLAARLRRDGAIPPEGAIDVMLGLCRALEVAHEQGLVHRDVKPGNVMLGDDGRVRLVDLGIARVGGLDGLTTTGTVMGSAAYLSPEQASGAAGDQRSDVYALGCVLFEMLTGRPPFVADSPVATAFLHVNEEPSAPSSIAPVPDALDAVVLLCLAKEPDRRYATVAEVEAALVRSLGSADTLRLPTAGSFADTEPVTAIGTGSRRPRWWLVGVAIVLMVLTAGLVASIADPLRPRQIRQDAVEAAASGVASDVSIAWIGVVDAVAAGVLGGGIEEAMGQTLADRAVAILDAYERGDPGAMSGALSAFERTVDGGVQRGAISPDASAEIDVATTALVEALRGEGVLDADASAPVATTGASSDGPGDADETGGGDDGGGGDGGDSGHGPPPHAEANGHEDD